MKATTIITSLVLLISLLAAGQANAYTPVDITSDFDTDTVLSADNVYNLTKPIFVRNGATLTIPAGTVFATVPKAGLLVVSRGSQIFVLGTKTDPVIMTSDEDVATWATTVQGGTGAGNPIATGPIARNPEGFITSHPTGADPTTGTWRNANGEWGNLAVLGKGVISASHFGGVQIGPSTTGATFNPTVVDGTAQKRMEGLDPSDPGSGDVDDIRYGGNDDNDDSGTINYISFRYTGRVLGVGDELNGLSLGAIGSETDLRYIDIMNNVDDGIEMWGGKFCIRNVNIWNIGDDSFDIDQGARFQAQFGLIVQGSCGVGGQGGGIGDNIFEHDGGELQSTQPTTTSVIYNFTAIGMVGGLVKGDGATTWRDNCNMQYRQCSFIDVGEELVRFDNLDGDGAEGYNQNDGSNPGLLDTSLDGTMNFVDRWTTAWNAFGSTAFTVNAGSGAYAPGTSFYSAQFSGTLCEISDSVFYNLANQLVDGTFESTDAAGTGDIITAQSGPSPRPRTTSVGVLTGTAGGGFTGANFNNVLVTNIANLPVQAMTKGTIAGGYAGQEYVTSLNPCAANDATSKANASTIPAAGCCLIDVPFRGGFSATHNWAKGWTAADAFGFMAGPVVDDPATTIELTSLVSFTAQNGVLYVVEESTDGKRWCPVLVVEGDGSVVKYADLDGLTVGKLYRASPL